MTLLNARTAPDGLILAGGAARRMGRPKALLDVEGERFIERTVRMLREGGCRSVYVVATNLPELHEAVEQLGAILVRNENPASEQIDSVRLGLRALPDDSTAAAVLPVDCPLVSSATVQSLAAAASHTTLPVVLPMYNGVGGHPVILRRPFYDIVLDTVHPEGLSGIIIEHGHDVELLPVTDPGILVDIDTPEEYERLIGSATAARGTDRETA